MRSFVSLLIGIAALSAATAEGSNGPEHVRVLLVTGMDPVGHNWRETTPTIRKVLAEDSRLDVRIVEDPAFLESPVVADYDVIVLNFKDVSADETVRWGWQAADDHLPAHAARIHDNLSKVVEGGKGLVVLHFGCGAFPDWPEFANLAGRVWNRDVRSHDPRGPFDVEIVNRQHPITRGMQDFEADDELFICLQGEQSVEVLATARSKLTGKDHPMAFVLEYGKGRVFHTPLGHDVRAIEMPGVANLIRRGCVWAAGRQP